MNKSSTQNKQSHRTPQSMTGYAVENFDFQSKSYRIHLKSVNNKYFDLKWRVPRNWLALEFSARKSLQKVFTRGSFDFWVEEISQTQNNSQTAQNYLKKLELTLSSLKDIDSSVLPLPSAASILSRSPELWIDNDEQKFIDEENFQNSFQKLLDNLKNEREKEGHCLVEVLLKEKEHIQTQHLSIINKVPALRETIAQNYKERIKELISEKVLSESIEGRLQSEILFLLERRDISEELERIRIHLEKLEALLKKPLNNLGKRVDFIAQELNREWSTLGNKIHNTSLFDSVAEAKLSIDKIREQALNLS